MIQYVFLRPITRRVLLEPQFILPRAWLRSEEHTSELQSRGHLVCRLLLEKKSGRYKSLVVDGSGNGYLRTVCDYVHLNPVRANLLPPEASLQEFAWSSYPQYLQSARKRPAWLRVDRVLGELGIQKDDAKGRRR